MRFFAATSRGLLAEIEARVQVRDGRLVFLKNSSLSCADRASPGEAGRGQYQMQQLSEAEGEEAGVEPVRSRKSTADSVCIAVEWFFAEFTRRTGTEIEKDDRSEVYYVSPAAGSVPSVSCSLIVYSS